jgi:3,4-dihydroxyphenylacetate 2,3-dioxygenase
MGQVVLAAKVTHVPSLLLSEREGALKGRRAFAIESLKEIGKRARDRRADTFLIFDTHWLSNFGFNINANKRHAGSYTSHEAPHMIQDLTFEYSGNPVLADLIAEEAASDGLEVHAHRIRKPGARIWKYRSYAIHECRRCAQRSARGVAAFRQHRGEPQIR